MMYYLTNIWDFLFFHIPRFIKNLWKFRKVIYNHYPYDYHSTLCFLQVALKDISDYCEKHGYEVDVSRIKKVKKMRRAVKIIENINEDKYHELAEKELGKIPEHLMFWIYQKKIHLLNMLGMIIIVYHMEIFWPALISQKLLLFK